VKLSSKGQLSAAWLLCRLAGLYTLFSILKHVLPVTTLVRWAWRAPDPIGFRDVERRAWVAVRTSRSLRFGDSDCLQRSLLLYHVLSRAGADPALVIGFRRGNGSVAGHASVFVAGKPLYETAVASPPFEPALWFGARGRLLGSEAMSVREDCS
jgi:hypothetical protein